MWSVCSARARARVPPFAGSVSQGLELAKCMAIALAAWILPPLRSKPTRDMRGERREWRTAGRLAPPTARFERRTRRRSRRTLSAWDAAELKAPPLSCQTLMDLGPFLVERWMALDSLFGAAIGSQPIGGTLKEP